jgi:hypothetical protein
MRPPPSDGLAFLPSGPLCVFACSKSCVSWRVIDVRAFSQLCNVCSYWNVQLRLNVELFSVQIKGDSRGKVNILRGDSTGYYEKKVCIVSPSNSE